MNKSRGAAKRCLPELWCASAAQIAKTCAARARVCRNKARAARARVCMRSGKVPQGKARAVRVGAVRARGVGVKPARHAQGCAGKSPRGTRGRGKGLKGEETGEKRKDNVEASDITAAGGCQRSGRTFVPVYDLGGSLARIDGGSGRVCRGRADRGCGPDGAQRCPAGGRAAARTASGHRHRRGAWRHGWRGIVRRGRQRERHQSGDCQVSGGRGSAVSGRGHHDAHR